MGCVASVQPRLKGLSTLAQMAELFPSKRSAFRAEFLFRSNIEAVILTSPAGRARAKRHTRLEISLEIRLYAIFRP
jgi:hypothetical protein